MPIALLIALLMPILGIIHLTPMMHSSPTRPSVVENGTDVVSVPFPTDLPNGTLNSLAFGPDGTAYFVDAPGEIASVSPTGVYTKIPAPRVVYSGAMLYAHGSLWTAAREGVVRVAVNGANSRWYELNQGEAKFGTSGYGGIINGPNGSVLIVGYLVNSKMGTLTGEIVSIDIHGNATLTPVPGQPQGPLVFDSAGHLYFGYTPPGSAFGIARLETNGSVTTLPFPYPQYTLTQINSMVDVHGTLYFTGLAYIYTVQQGEHAAGFFGKIPPNGAISQIPLLGGDATYVFQMTADFGGNLWLSLNDGPGYFLYGYDTYNGKYSAAIEPGILDQIYTGPYIGPDDNIWTVRYDTDPHHYYEPTGFDVYVKHVQTLEPTTLALAHGQTSSFSILEPHVNGPWTAQSLSPTIATVSPASSTTGVFTVLGESLGTTRIGVKDRFGNVSYETITSN